MIEVQLHSFFVFWAVLGLGCAAVLGLRESWRRGGGQSGQGDRLFFCQGCRTLFVERDSTAARCPHCASLCKVYRAGRAV